MKKEKVIEMSEKLVLFMAKSGYGKLVTMNELNDVGLGNTGVLCGHLSRESSSKLVSVAVVDEDDEVIVLSRKGMVNKLSVSGMSIRSLNVAGQKLVRLSVTDEIVDMAVVGDDK